MQARVESLIQAHFLFGFLSVSLLLFGCTDVSFYRMVSDRHTTNQSCSSLSAETLVIPQIQTRITSEKINIFQLVQKSGWKQQGVAIPLSSANFSKTGRICFSLFTLKSLMARKSVTYFCENIHIFNNQERKLVSTFYWQKQKKLQYQGVLTFWYSQTENAATRCWSWVALQLRVNHFDMIIAFW